MGFDGYVDILGKNIRCLLVEHSEAEKKPIIVIFPGDPGFGYGLYCQHSSFLEEEASVLYFDPAGYGESQAREYLFEYTMENYVKDVCSILHKINVNLIDICYIKKLLVQEIKFFYYMVGDAIIVICSVLLIS